MKYSAAIFLLSFFFMPQIVFATISHEDIEQIFELGQETTSVTFVDTVHISGKQSSTSFTLLNNLIANLSSIKAYDFADNSKDLNFTSVDIGNNSYTININFPRTYNESETYKFVLKFETKRLRLPQEGFIAYYPWSWGGAHYHTNLTYLFVVPPFYDIKSDFESSIEITDKSIIKFNDFAKRDSYYEINFSLSKVSPPRIIITKGLSENEITKGDTIVVFVVLTNGGDSIAKKVCFVDTTSILFEYRTGNKEWCGDLKPNEQKLLKYTAQSIAVSKKDSFGEGKATYTDLWNTRTYEVTSDDNAITVNKPPNIINLFGIEIPIPADPLPVVYNFFIGYGILMWVYVLRRKDFKTWKDTPAFDKVIYSLITAGFNLILVGVFYLLFLVFVPQILQVKNIEYAIFLTPIPITAWLIEKVLGKITIKIVHVIFFILLILFYIILSSVYEL